jgi:hypothetical protein
MILGSLNLSSDLAPIPFPSRERGDARLILCNTLSMDNYFTIVLSNSRSEVTSCIYFNCPLLAFDTFVIPFTLSLADGDIITAKASNSGVVMSLVK